MDPEGLTEGYLDVPSPSWRATYFSAVFQHNFIWWIWPSWLRRQIVALKIVGSSPIIHPIKQRHPIGMPLFYGMDIGLERRKRKHASGMFSRRGRVLRPARRSPVDCELSGGFCLIRLPLGCLHFMEWIRDSKSRPGVSRWSNSPVDCF